MKAYKATDKQGKCRNITLKVGKTYEVKGTLELCQNGLHFCANLFDVYNYYDRSEATRIFEIEALGEIKTEGDKSATNKLKVLRELSTEELLKAWINRTNSGNRNSGDWNSGNRNSGDWNSGNRNSGDWNSGDGNSGDGNSGNRNSGDWNSGDWNSGDWNSGNRNSGNRNSGYGNSGNRNSGDWNSGDGNSGYFNTSIPLYFFNKPSELEYTDELAQKIRNINVKPILQYITSSSMTDTEKTENPSHAVIGGFLRKTERHNWSHLTDADKEFIRSLPNYSDEIFMIISGGISIEAPKILKVVVNGQEVEIDMQKARLLGLIK